LNDKSAIMLTESDDHEDLKTVSLIAASSRSVLCVPLIVLERVLGVIYLDSDDPTTRFDENHLQLLTAVAAISAVAIENVRNFERLQNENARLMNDVDIEHNMVGESPLLQRVYQLISKVAPTDSTVLISGESGTGKELAARAIHRNSKRADKPFIAVNCAALAESLLESELFGHEKGAFTGALLQKKGRLELADSGTIFLDEIGDLSAALQTKLLRVLQEREFERVGGNRTIKIDVRVLAATNRDLEDAMVRGSFRRDLYFRLNVVNLKMPTLRERREDIPLLANYFARKYGDKCNRVVFGISPDARRLLMNYEWPGNVRELENAIERAIVLGTTDHILPDDLPEVVVEFQGHVSGESGSNYHEQVVQMKRKMIIDAVKQANGNYTAAARLLNLHPNYLHRLIRNLNLKDELNK
jgi:Nif-specific regulatory protein